MSEPHWYLPPVRSASRFGATVIDVQFQRRSLNSSWHTATTWCDACARWAISSKLFLQRRTWCLAKPASLRDTVQCLVWFQARLPVWNRALKIEEKKVISLFDYSSSWFSLLISEHLLQITFMSTSCEIAPRWMPQNTCGDKSTFVQLMARQQAITYNNVDPVQCRIWGQYATY